MQSIKIKNLGPITYFEADVQDVNIFIGEQATGKSTISKSIYFFHAMKEFIIEYLYAYTTSLDYTRENRFPSALNRKGKELFIDLFGFSWDLDEKLFMSYRFTPAVSITVSLTSRRGKKYIDISYSKQLRNEIRSLQLELSDHPYQLNEFDFYFMRSEPAQMLRGKIVRRVQALFEDAYDLYYIPAGRQLLTLLTGQRTKLDYGAIDYVNRRFMQFNESIQSRLGEGILSAAQYYPEAAQRFDPFRIAGEIMDGLKGDYRVRAQKEYLILKDGREVAINFASSGQQEVLWLFIQLYILMLRGNPAFVIIEEPEAHLYPSLQKKVMEFIAQFVNVNKSRVLLTTHSPYMLTVANVLYYAGKLGKTYPNGIHKILHRDMWIDPERFSGWKLSRKENETVFETMLDSELHEIAASEIDGVSDEIDKLYSSLYYFEVDHEHP